MEATGSCALLRRLPIGFRPAMAKAVNSFKDEGHLRYYASTSKPVMCGVKEEKRRMKLVKGLAKDLSAFYSVGLCVDQKEERMVGEVKGQMLSEAAELLLTQLNQLRAEAKEMKKRRKQDKAAMKASKVKDCEDDSSSSSSSESSDSECETAVKMGSLRTETKPNGNPDAKTTELQTECSSTRSCCRSSAEVAVKAMDKIEVCMGGKCKKSGAMELLEEFERKVGIEGAVVGCKCMGKCRDGPNVRVVNRSSEEEEGVVKVSRNPLCIGVGLEDVGSIVANFFGENKDVGLLPV